MAAAVPHADVHAVLQICGFTDDNARNNLITNETFFTLDAIMTMENDADVDSMAKREASRTVAERRVLITTVQLKNLQGLVWWLHDRSKHHLPLDAAAFDAAELANAIARKRMEKDIPEPSTTVKDLGKFHPDDFDQHEDAFLNLLSQTTGVHKTSLRYVCRDDVAPAVFASTEEERMYQLALNGVEFDQDNRSAYRMLKAFLINTPGWPWIEPFDATENGRGAFFAWTGHYNGRGELSKRVKLAEARLNSLHYKNERSMPFEHVQTLMTKAILTLRKSPEDRLSNRQEVDRLLKCFNPQDNELIAAKAVVRDRYSDDFAGACAYLGATIASVHGAAQVEAMRYRQNKRRISAVAGGNYQRGGRGRGRFGGRGGGRGGRGFGRGGRFANGRQEHRVVFNGIDVTDVHQNFTNNQFERIGPQGRAYVLRQREHLEGRNGGGQGRSQGRGGQRDRNDRNVSGVGTRNQNQNQDCNDSNQNETNERGSQNGTRFGRGAYQQGRGGRS